MSKPTWIDRALLDDVARAARDAPRRRRNRNFHADEAARCNRLLNAIEPGSYIRPHRHAHPDKDESIVVLRGRIGVLFFDPDGTVSETAILETDGAVIGVDVPHGTFHSLVALETGTVFFEAKAGPYEPLTPDEMAPWAPAEGDPGAEAYYDRLRALFA
jgi:cupin fold WbuC family metalloprotein